MTESLGATMIADERSRQIEVEGYAALVDDGYTNYELSSAAQAYLVDSFCTSDEAFESIKGSPPYCYPWGASTWNPSKDPIRNLAKAGALIAAEIDRLIRMEGNGKKESKG